MDDIELNGEYTPLELLKQILPSSERYNKNYLLVSKLNYKDENVYELEYGCMFEAPHLGFQQLKQLSDLFGTDCIDVNHYSEGGCETCDWGSNYYNTIQIKNITKNEDLLKSCKPIYSKE